MSAVFTVLEPIIIICSNLALYLQELFLPLLSGDPSVTYLEPGAGLDKAELQTQQATLQRYCGKMFASQEQLSACGRMFSVMINSASTDAE